MCKHLKCKSLKAIGGCFQGHAVAFGVGASTNNLWLYLLRVLASFFSIIWIFQPHLPPEQTFLETISINSCSWRRNRKKSNKPRPCCQCPLDWYPLKKNTLYHCFCASFNSQRVKCILRCVSQEVWPPSHQKSKQRPYSVFDTLWQEDP